MRLQAEMGDGWTPCPPDTGCRNCDHPLRGHFRAGTDSQNYGTACGECPCPVWHCQHTGYPWPQARPVGTYA